MKVSCERSDRHRFPGVDSGSCVRVSDQSLNRVFADFDGPCSNYRNAFHLVPRPPAKAQSPKALFPQQIYIRALIVSSFNGYFRFSRYDNSPTAVPLWNKRWLKIEAMT
jgi:hypothetical protein